MELRAAKCPPYAVLTNSPVGDWVGTWEQYITDPSKPTPSFPSFPATPVDWIGLPRSQQASLAGEALAPPRTGSDGMTLMALHAVEAKTGSTFDLAIPTGEADANC